MSKKSIDESTLVLPFSLIEQLEKLKNTNLNQRIEKINKFPFTGKCQNPDITFAFSALKINFLPTGSHLIMKTCSHIGEELA